MKKLITRGVILLIIIVVELNAGVSGQSVNATATPSSVGYNGSTQLGFTVTNIPTINTISWTPSFYLNDPSIPNPVASNLTSSLSFTVTINNQYTDNVYVTVYDPVIQTHPSDATICNGGNASFTVIEDPTYNVSYQWQFNLAGWVNIPNVTPFQGVNDQTLIINNVTSTSSYAGLDYRCKVTDQNNPLNFQFSESVNIIINSLPTSLISGGEEICQGQSTDIDIFFTGQAPWTVTYTNGNTSNTITTSDNPYNFMVSEAGSYVVTALSDGKGCIGSSLTGSALVVVYPEPSANFTFTIECQGDPTQFTDGSSIPSGSIIEWDWEFGDGLGTSNEQNPSYIYNSFGSFNVELVVTSDNGCQDIISKSVTVYPTPEADFIFTPECLGNTTEFTDMSSLGSGNIISWAWDFGDGTGTSNEQNPSYTYSAFGIYSVELIVVSDNNCQHAVTKNVSVFAVPSADFFFDTACFGNATNFIDESVIGAGSINNWEWDFGDGAGTSNLQNPSYTYSSYGTYNVELVITSFNGCMDSIDYNVEVYSTPVADFTFSTECFGTPTEFTDESSIPAGSIVSWAWDFGDGAGTSEEQSPNYDYTSFGTYNVELVVTSDNGCQDIATYSVTVHPMPEADFTFSEDCFGTPTEFTDISFIGSGNIDSWSWDFGDGSNSTLQHPVHLYSVSGNFNVQLTVISDNGCINTVNYDVIVYPVPEAYFTFTIACLGNPTEFTDESVVIGGINSWNWDFGDGNTSIQQNPSYTYINAGSYDVRLIVDTEFGCRDTIHQDVNVVTEYPVNVSISASTDDICENEPVAFTALPQNPGNNPVYYWLVNNVIIDSTSLPAITLSYLNDEDEVSCLMKSSFPCAINNPAASNAIPIQVSPYIIANFVITPSNNPTCDNESVTFSPTDLINEGDNPIYRWFLNDIYKASGASWTTLVENGNKITAEMESDATCVENNPVMAQEAIFMNVNPSPSLLNSGNLIPKPINNPVVLICMDSSASYNYQWYENGIEIEGANEQFYYPAKYGLTFENDMAYHVRIENEFACASSSNPYEYALNKSALFNESEIFIVYPNPGNGSFFLELNEDRVPENIETFSMTITDMEGRVKFKSDVSGIQNHFNLNNLQRGVYLLQVDIPLFSNQFKKLVIQ